MGETERTAITNGDDSNPIEVDVVESVTTPGVFGLVGLCPDGSSIG